MYLPIKDAKKICFKRFGDSRGYFNELFNEEKCTDLIGKKWKQVSFSNSSKNVLRGLHCSPYGKFITCTRGAFYDVIADFRPDSPTFGKWCKVLLTETNCTQVYVPAYCGHGFYTLEDNTNALYLQEGCFNPENENDTHPFDPFIDVKWPIDTSLPKPVLSQKDENAPYLSSRFPVPETRMRILVIGGSGQIGTAIMNEFGKENCTGTYYNSRHKDGMVYFDMENADNEGYTEYFFDLINPTHVFICTGFTWVDGCENDTVKCEKLNHEMPLHICKVAKKYSCKTIWFSTDYVFDGENGPYDEKSNPNPINEYGKSKFRGENALSLEDPTCLILRTNVVYGHDENQKNFVYQVLNKNVSCVPSDQLSTPTYNKDIAKVCKQLIEEDKSGIFHVTGDEFVSRKDFTKMIYSSFLVNCEEPAYTETKELNQCAKRPLKGGLVNTKINFNFTKISQAFEDMKV